MSDRGFEAHLEGSEDAPLLRLRGELDIGSADDLEKELRRAEESRPREIVLDLRGLTFLDSTGLRILIAADARAKEEGRGLSLVAGQPQVHRVFEVALLDRRFRFVEEPLS